MTVLFLSTSSSKISVKEGENIFFFFTMGEAFARTTYQLLLPPLPHSHLPGASYRVCQKKA